MPLVAAKCTQCGANIEVDDTREGGICKFCGTAFITEKAINNYSTYITNNYTTNNNFSGATVTMVSADIDGLFEKAKKELLLQNWKNANVYLDEIKKADANAIQIISNLFKETNVLQVVKKLWIQSPESAQTKEALDEIVSYDSQNIEVWLFLIETSIFTEDIISYGNKAIALAPDIKKEYYKNKVYTLYIEKDFDPHIAFSMQRLVDEIPASAIMNNKVLNDLLYNKCREFIITNKQIIGSYSDMLNRFAEKLQDNQRVFIQDMLYSKKRNNGKLVVKGSDGSCYVATCVYGSYDCPEVWTLRRFRDYTLNTTWYGRLFIRCYYAISPTIVKWFGQTKWFKAFWKTKLDKMVHNLNNKGIANTLYTDFDYKK